MTNELGFANLIGASADVQAIAAAIPEEFAKKNGLVIGAGLTTLQAALTNSVGQIGTNVTEALRNFKDPIVELKEAIDNQVRINEGNEAIAKTDQANEALKESRATLENLLNQRTSGQNVRTIDYESRFNLRRELFDKRYNVGDRDAMRYKDGPKTGQDLVNYIDQVANIIGNINACLLYTSPSPRD